MPQVGQDLETARIIEWHVCEGDTVAEGDLIATVESDKASFEVEAPASGIVTQLLFKAGDEAAVFKPIAFIGTPDEQNPKLQDAVSMPETVFANGSPVAKTAIEERSAGSKVFMSPSARRIASERGLTDEELAAIIPASPDRLTKSDILGFIETRRPEKKLSPLAKKICVEEGIDSGDIEGTGSNLRIMKKDVYAVMGGTKSSLLKSAPEDKVLMFDKTRKRIAERLTLSKQSIPHFYLFATVDMGKALAWKELILSQLGSKVSVNDMIIKSVAMALKKFPVLNAHADDEKTILKPDINIGVAVSTDKGLFVPVIHAADTLNLNEIHQIAAKNAEDARRGIVQVKHVGTFTISNLGMFGVERFLPIINPPECAILSVGAIEKMPVCQGEAVVVSDVMTLGLACDHRAIDGAMAANFLSHIKSLLEAFGNTN